MAGALAAGRDPKEYKGIQAWVTSSLRPCRDRRGCEYNRTRRPWHRELWLHREWYRFRRRRRAPVLSKVFFFLWTDPAQTLWREFVQSGKRKANGHPRTSLWAPHRVRCRRPERVRHRRWDKDKSCGRGQRWPRNHLSGKVPLPGSPL